MNWLAYPVMPSFALSHPQIWKGKCSNSVWDQTASLSLLSLCSVSDNFLSFLLAVFDYPNCK